MKRILFISLGALATLSGSALELNLTPGSLPLKMAEIKVAKDDRLLLKGSATSFDLTSLRHLPADVKTLDLSGLVIKDTVLAKGDYYGQREFAAGEIPHYMLLSTGVGSVTLPQSVSRVGEGAFSSTPLETIKISGATEIGAAAFHGCGSLKSADLSDCTLAELPARVFSECVSLSDVELPGSIRTIGPRAFMNSGVVRVSVPGATEIGDYAFAGASRLSEIEFASGCRIGEGAFYGDSALENIAGLENMTGDAAPLLAANSSVGKETLTIASPEVGEGAFSGSPARQLVLRNGVKKLGSLSFHNMKNLEGVDVRELGENIPEAAEDAFQGVKTAEVPLYVTASSENLWKSAPVWKEFDIRNNTSSGGEITSVDDILVERSGNSISVASGAVLTNVSVYSLDGALISSVNPGTETYSLELPQDTDVVVIRIMGGSSVKVVKLVK